MHRLLNLLLLRAVQLLPSGMSCPIMAGPLKGRQWIVGAAPGPGKGMSVVINRHEQGMTRYAHHLLANAGREYVCFDLGANVGFYTLLFSRYAKKVYAFEPLPRNIRYLVQLLEINRVRNAQVIAAAVSSCPRIGLFAEGENAAMGRLDAEGCLPVPIIACDQFAAATGVLPDLLKIDVEGDELNVLHGARNVLTQQHPCILLSVHSGQLHADCLRFLSEIGYTAFTPLNADSLQQASEFAACWRS